ncbi:MAG: hypothetical protein Q8S26_08920 [Azonexus sp.]|nr:hypothetical protein [Azonexus sp.]
MKPKQRWLVIGGLLFATLLAGYFADDDAVPEKGKRKSNAVAKTTTSASAGEKRRSKAGDKAAELAAAPLSFPEPAVASEEPETAAIDPFRPKTWFVPPPPPPPPTPKAPPLPFLYIGKLIEDGEPRVFLHHQGKQMIARVGDLINGVYAVEEISSGQMTFIYQPLKEKQVLAIGTDK